MEHVSHDVATLFEYFLWFICFFVVFSLLAQLVPNIKGQKLIRKEIGTDLMYWFVMPLFYSRFSEWLLIAILIVVYGSSFTEQTLTYHGFPIIRTLPTLVQVMLALLIFDAIQYWTHRLFHDKVFWKFHAIHHAPRELDWLSGVRFHPVNLVIHSSLVATIVYLIGFSSEVFVFLVPYTIFYAALVHANLNWTFGPLKYIFASPVFHRWHHTSPEEGGEKNFAPLFAFTDLLFGTFYMPKEKLPMKFGVSDPVPDTFLGQLLYPFKK